MRSQLRHRGIGQNSGLESLLQRHRYLKAPRLQRKSAHKQDEEDLLKGMKVWPDCNPGDWFYLAVQEATNSHDYKDRGGEVWTKLTRDPDWTRYER